VFRSALVHSDRGKPRWRDDFDDPSTYLVPALNHHTDEISCAIGYASLRRLPSTIVNRLSFVSDFVARLYDASNVS
jgi:perosamine synthetase